MRRDSYVTMRFEVIRRYCVYLLIDVVFILAYFLVCFNYVRFSFYGNVLIIFFFCKKSQRIFKLLLFCENMLLFKVCLILSCFLLFVEVKNSKLGRFILLTFLWFQGSLFAFGGKAKNDGTVGSSDDRQKEIDAIRKDINSNSAEPPPVSYLYRLRVSKSVVITISKKNKLVWQDKVHRKPLIWKYCQFITTFVICPERDVLCYYSFLSNNLRKKMTKV